MNSQSPTVPGVAHSISASHAVILTLCCASFALGQVGIKYGADFISPLFHAFVRSMGAAVLLLVWMRSRGIPLVLPDGNSRRFVVAGLFFGFEFVFLFPGIVLAGAARGTLLIYTTPFFVAIGAHFLIAGDQLHSRKLIGLIAAFLGVVLVFADKVSVNQIDSSGQNAIATIPANLQTFVTWTGLSPSIVGGIFCILAAMLWAATTLYMKATPLKTVSPERNLCWQLIVSIPVLAIASTLLGEPGVIQSGPPLFWVLAYSIGIVAFISFLTFFWMLRSNRPTVVHTFTMLTPIFAAVLAALFIGEPLTVKLVIALIAVSAGIFLVNSSRR